MEDLRVKLWTRWLNGRCLHDLTSLNSINKGNALTRRLVKKGQDGTIGRLTEDDLDDDMLVGGDINISTTNQSGRPSSGLGTVGKVALALGLVASGAGIGALVPIVLNAVGQKAVDFMDQDTDTQYNVETYTGGELLPVE